MSSGLLMIGLLFKPTLINYKSSVGEVVKIFLFLCFWSTRKNNSYIWTLVISRVSFQSNTIMLFWSAEYNRNIDAAICLSTVYIILVSISKPQQSHIIFPGSSDVVEPCRKRKWEDSLDSYELAFKKELMALFLTFCVPFASRNGTLIPAWHFFVVTATEIICCWWVNSCTFAHPSTCFSGHLPTHPPI